MYSCRSTCFFFFVSSRRRHTISYGDWSSDVCSSDLLLHQHGGRGAADPGTGHRGAEAGGGGPGSAAPRPPCWCSRRSEERRVGKECRSRRKTNAKERKRERVCRSTAKANMSRWKQWT